MSFWDEDDLSQVLANPVCEFIYGPVFPKPPQLCDYEHRNDENCTSQDNDIVQITQFGFAFLLFLVFGLWLSWKSFLLRKGDARAANSMLLPIYTKFLWICVVAAFVRMVMTLIIYLQGGLWMTNTPVWAAAMYGICYVAIRPVIWDFAMLLVVQKHLGKRSFKRAMLVAGVIFLFWASAGAVAVWNGHILNKSLATLVLTAVLSMSTTYHLCVMSYMLHAKLRRYQPSIYVFVSFCLLLDIVQLTAFAFELCMVDGYCLLTLSNYMSSVLGPFFLFHTIWSDSQYWRSFTDELRVGPRGRRPSRKYKQLVPKTEECTRELMDFLTMATSVLDFAQVFWDSEQPIGAGATALVYKARYKDKIIALKELHTTDLKLSVICDFLQETFLSVDLKHPNVVPFLGVMLQPPTLYLVYEYCSEGDLQRLLFDPKRDGELTVRQRLRFALQAATALEYIHRQDVCHRDVKTANFLVDKDPRTGNLIVKIADFGQSRMISDSTRSRATSKGSLATTVTGKSYQTGYLPPRLPSARSQENGLMGAVPASPRSTASWSPRRRKKGDLTTNIGSPCFLAPEVMRHLETKEFMVAPVFAKRHTQYGFAVDVYGFAGVMWEIATRRMIYENHKVAQIKSEVMSNLRPKMPPPSNCPHVEGFPSEYVALMYECWDQDPQLRPPFGHVRLRLEQMIANMDNPQRAFHSIARPNTRIPSIHETRQFRSYVNGLPEKHRNIY